MQEEGSASQLTSRAKRMVELAWTDRDLYHRRHLKAASALVAVRDVLARRRPLGGGEDEFLSLFERVTSADPELFTALWSDPAAYFWSRLAYEVVGACVAPAPGSRVVREYRSALGDPTPAELLRLHLDEFKRFALSAAWLVEEDLRFAAPLEVALPFALPGTRWVLSGRGKIAIEGVSGRRVLVVGRASPAEPRECPAAMVGDVELALNPAAFHLRGIDFADALLEFAGDYQAEHRGLVERSLELVRRHAPDVFGHFEEMRILALKPESVGEYTNLSYSDLPGAAVCGVLREPYCFADALIHELHHNRLFFIEESGRFLVDSDDPERQATYYSPWREDLRPLHGLLHALYVFLPVWRFWRAVGESGETDGALADMVRDQLVRLPLQLAIAARQLERHARFTELGAELFAELAREVAEIRRASPRPSGAASVPAMTCREDGVLETQKIGADQRPGSVRDALLDHLARYDRFGQCGEVAAALLD